MVEEFLKSPIIVRDSRGRTRTFTFSLDEALFSNVDDVPVALFYGDAGRGYLRFDFDPPEFTDLDRREGFRLSLEDFIELVKTSRAERRESNKQS